MLLHLSKYYFAAFALAELLIFIFKGSVLPYSTFNVTYEVILIFLLSGVEWVRIFLGSKGNLTERTMPVVLSILLSVPSFVCVLYFLLWQTYVLRIEAILSGILLVLQGLQFIFAVFSVITFARMAPYG
ncbi:Uncharacterised protein g9486 [Pycnogonum litorale]